ncbi:hypothetical protein SBD_0948 [Streptomyces bottropensis ATCC 25435]|uniref:Uncharacterized protein n=1 Tax=Streptomyces bottropensis ATCC 25435 TaxID=1054862 RepID=M3EP50_9ACTN|nr:hypothetical protein SBD_0948 [Streptomyces bottropensis ATCC 25435]
MSIPSLGEPEIPFAVGDGEKQSFIGALEGLSGGWLTVGQDLPTG